MKNKEWEPTQNHKLRKKNESFNYEKESHHINRGLLLILLKSRRNVYFGLAFANIYKLIYITDYAWQ